MYRVLHEKKLSITFVIRQVPKLHGFAHFLVSGAAQLHVHGDRRRDGGVAVGRRTEDDSHLSVYICLGEGTSGLPGLGEEAHFYII